MWVSKKKWNDLVERVHQLEDATVILVPKQKQMPYYQHLDELYHKVTLHQFVDWLLAQLNLRLHYEKEKCWLERVD
jgi:hypothetical protein